ncbi:cell division protein FtsZ [Effusibacillus lacus]|uniref:Cell division protein FtsZ n=2 Tax=Effusibacillus lacus TaxID=1348429 RepID=A0A292YE80_9BACL|nr:cell division protein FtsZ [Effusibacillus lacus]
MVNPVRIFKIKQELSERDRILMPMMGRDDICFFRFVGGNSGETERLMEQLYRLKSRDVLLVGIFRFPFRFEGKKRLQKAISQYYQMKELCDAITYLHSDGMMEILTPGTTIQEANLVFELLEEAPIRAIEEMIQVTGEMNIDVKDIQTFLRNGRGPVYIRTFEGDSFDEPLKYAISTPYLPQDYTEGKQMIINIGCTKDVDMVSFQQINLRLNDLFHKTDLFKLGTYLMDEPGPRFKITLIVNGMKDPFPQPEKMKKLITQRLWFKKKWELLTAATQKTGQLLSKKTQKQEAERKTMDERNEGHTTGTTA